ncbi:uncharacterized protein LOC144135175 [Amblyomma americanum]
MASRSAEGSGSPLLYAMKSPGHWGQARPMGSGFTHSSPYRSAVDGGIPLLHASKRPGYMRQSRPMNGGNAYNSGYNTGMENDMAAVKGIGGWGFGQQQTPMHNGGIPGIKAGRKWRLGKPRPIMIVIKGCPVGFRWGQQQQSPLLLG